MERRTRAAIVGFVSLALVVSLIGILPAVDAKLPPRPSCTIIASPRTISRFHTVDLTVTLSNGPHSVVLSAAVTVEREPIKTTSSTDTTDLSTNVHGYGTATVAYPTDFPSPGSTAAPGPYSASAVVTGYSIAVACHTNFAVVSRK